MKSLLPCSSLKVYQSLVVKYVQDSSLVANPSNKSLLNVNFPVGSKAVLLLGLFLLSSGVVWAHSVTPTTALHPSPESVHSISDISDSDQAVVDDEMDNGQGYQIMVTFVSDDITSALCDGASVTVTRTYHVEDCSHNSIDVYQSIVVGSLPFTNPRDAGKLALFKRARSISNI